MYEEFEKAREQALESYSSPSQWIKKWEIQHTKNPYYETRISGGETAVSPSGSAYGEQGGEWGEKFYAKGGASEVGMGQRELESQPWYSKYKTPETPAWLSKYTGQKAGTPIEKTRKAITPSPQSWRGLSWPQQQKLGGYVSWTGGSPTDYLERMWQMQPKKPSLGRRWQPTKQRGSL
jgi:hypothetical protein